MPEYSEFLDRAHLAECAHMCLNRHLYSRYVLGVIAFACWHMAALKPRFVCHGYKVCVTASHGRPSTRDISSQLSAVFGLNEILGRFCHANIMFLSYTRVRSSLLEPEYMLAGFQRAGVLLTSVQT